jgi:CheY-like chemotaxis protein
MNGAEAILEIKSDPATKDFKVVFLTNYGEAQKEMTGLDEKFAKEVGAFSYIRKTDDLDGIVERIKNIFRASATNNTGNR